MKTRSNSSVVILKHWVLCAMNFSHKLLYSKPFVEHSTRVHVCLMSFVSIENNYELVHNSLICLTLNRICKKFQFLSIDFKFFYFLASNLYFFSLNERYLKKLVFAEKLMQFSVLFKRVNDTLFG